MTKFIPFTEAQKQQARETDLVDLLRSQGKAVKRSGSEYVWRDGPDKVTIRGNLWYHHYAQEGGDAIAFVRRFFHMSYPEAMQLLLGERQSDLQPQPTPAQKPKGELELPPRNERMSRVYAYLLTRRGIDRAVLNTFVHSHMIYESADYHNVVFVGYDRDGVPRHANLRGTGSESTFKGNAPGSVPEYSFHWRGQSGELYLFEAPIDMLSYISMHPENWQTHSYAAACSVSDRVLMQMLKDDPIAFVHLCLDSDRWGQEAAQRMQDKLYTMGVQSEILIPQGKDWNEDLLNFSQEEEPCMDLQF